MDNKALYNIYLLPTFIHIFLITIIVGLFKKAGFELGYNSMLGVILIILAGVSSAVWGIVYQKIHNRKKTLKIRHCTPKMGRRKTLFMRRVSCIEQETGCLVSVAF